MAAWRTAFATLTLGSLQQTHRSCLLPPNACCRIRGRLTRTPFISGKACVPLPFPPFAKKPASLSRRNGESRIPRPATAVSLNARASSSASISVASSDAGNNGNKRLVFLGTPEVAADVLRDLWQHTQRQDSGMEVVAVVTQPPTSRGRSRKKSELIPSAVAQASIELGVPEEAILTPATAKEEKFLQALQTLRPDLCITAAYGNFLPQAFLDIPTRGTVNIHPSLLPQLRGASPVQRALELGLEVTGVTVAYTALKMDAGPIVAQEQFAVDKEIKAPELLTTLFRLGAQLLLAKLPALLHGAPPLLPQDDSLATYAAKVSANEGVLDFSLPAIKLHNKVRAFAVWPGTRATLYVHSGQQTPSSGSGAARAETAPQELRTLDIKIITTRASPSVMSRSPGGEQLLAAALCCQGKRLVPVALAGNSGALEVVCDDGSILEILELQVPGKKVVHASAFWNGLRGQKLYR